jgi:hypothetical protein
MWWGDRGINKGARSGARSTEHLRWWRLDGWEAPLWRTLVVGHGLWAILLVKKLRVFVSSAVWLSGHEQTNIPDYARTWARHPLAAFGNSNC